MTVDLRSLGWDADFAAAYAAAVPPGPAVLVGPSAPAGADCRPGRVLRADRGVCTVLTAGGAVRASLSGTVLAAAGGDPSARPGAGDWVVVRDWPDGRSTAEAVLPRRTAVLRRTAGRGSAGQLLAANVDLAAVVEPIDPAPELGRVERLLALAWQSGAQPLVLVSKADLAADPVTVAAQVADVAPGVVVLPLSAERGTGIEELRGYLHSGRTLALLGPSGAGKSTIVNALAGAPAMLTQQVRRADGKGRHTTTYRALVPLPGGGAVLDTPGVRAVGLLDGAEGLARAFADVASLVAGCRFTDCGHGAEPGCQVRAALAAGRLTVRRWESWRRLRAELVRETGRRRARVDSLATAKLKRLARQARSRARP